MKNLLIKSLGITVLGLFMAVSALAQQEGDYRSAAQGDWSAAATWEVYQSGSWTAASTAPTGSETITVTGEDTVSVDVAVTITGNLVSAETGVVTVADGSLTVADGGVYEHNRDGGQVPTATWNAGSTIRITGVTEEAPDNSNQSYHHIVFNSPGLISNEHLSLDEVTIGGDVRVENTGTARWYLTSADPEDTSSVTIMGDLHVEGGQFAVQGTSGAYTVFEVHHYGDINVTGGNFSISRGSQGSGTGSTTWYLYGGDFSLSDAAMQNSNSVAGQASLVFAGAGTQTMSVTNIDYAGGDIHFHVSDSTTLDIATDFTANGQIVNEGEITTQGSLAFTDGGIYVHARDGGTVPTATWEEGSTAMFTGITSDAPEDRGQDYYNLTLDTPNMLSNNDLSLDGNTISGDLTVISSGESRWRLVGGDSGEITIMGDVIVDTASVETQGTSSPTDVVVHHYGDVVVNGGNLSVSRGSQGSGTGTSLWYLYEGDFTMTNGESRNSNPTDGNARFIFASGGTQVLTLDGDTDVEDLSIEVADSTTLDLGMSVIGGDGIFWLQDGATVATAHADGLDGNLQTEGEIVLGKMANFTYNGTDWQVLGSVLPDTLSTLTIANTDTVAAADTNYVSTLWIEEGATLWIDTTGVLTAAAGTVNGSLINSNEFMAESTIEFGGSAFYDHARNEGEIPDGDWAEGSTLRITGVTDNAPDNTNQNYHNIVFNTPGLISNEHLGLDEVTIGGDVHIMDTGDARWYFTSADPEDTSSVTVMGDVIMEAGAFAIQGTSSALTGFEVHHHGNIVVNGGNFSIARGSQSDTGYSVWYLYEGDFTMSDAETQNSNQGNTKFVFTADGTQQLSLTNVEIDNLPIEVEDGTTLDIGTSEIGGSDLFILNGGAGLATAHAGGIGGAILTTGEVTLSEEANYTFNGSEAQVTSEMMPTTVHDLVIDNEAGVTLSQETTITGTLRLVNGVFDNTIPFTLATGATIEVVNGSLLVNVAAEPTVDLPTEFQLYANYPNPFNPSTVIRYDIKEQVDVTVTVYDATGRLVDQLVNKSHAPGRYQVEWNAANRASGVYFYQIRAADWTATRSLLLVK